MTMSSALRERLIVQARQIIPREDWDCIEDLLENAYIYNNEGVKEILMFEKGSDNPGLIFDALTGSFLAPCGTPFIKEIISSGEKL